MNEKESAAKREGLPIEEKELTFMREQIKQRPVNSKKLFRRTLMTVTLAVVFGLVACLIFVLLVPAFTRLLNPEPAAEEISFPEDTVDEEIPPEDLYADDREIAENAEQELLTLLDNYSFKASDYGEIHTALRAVATEASASLVYITGVNDSVDWIEDLYGTSAAVSGLIVADDGTKTLILADVSSFLTAGSLRVTFSTQETCPGNLVIHDTVSLLGIIAVDHSRISTATRDAVTVAKLGNSLFPSLTGSAAIAIGTPAGVTGSLVYGMVTSNARTLDLADAGYTLITTNMTAEEDASGALIGTNGEVIAMIVPALTADAVSSSQLTAVGISSLKGLIEKLVNESPLPYAGIHGADLPQDVRKEGSIPQGVYVTRVDMDSPALLAGIQAGDIIVRYGTSDITTFATLVTAIRDTGAGRSVRVGFLRQGPDGYTRMNATIMPATTTVTEE